MAFDGDATIMRHLFKIPLPFNFPTLKSFLLA